MLVNLGELTRLTGNLPIEIDAARQPNRITFLFLWYQIDAVAEDRVGPQIRVDYETPGDDPACSAYGCPGFSATLLPADGCAPLELPAAGQCVRLNVHPEYGEAAVSPVDAGSETIGDAEASN
jgi:hypothetical protein